MQKILKGNNSIFKIAGCVILFNSSDSFIDNLRTYSHQVEKLYIVDNSDTINQNLVSKFSQFSNIEYINNGLNLGVGEALNKAAQLAYYEGYNYLLTLDDDSKLASGYVSVMINFLSNYSKPDKVAVLSPPHSKKLANKNYKHVTYTMTSGNLLNLDSYEYVGGFNSDLFIDLVDHEYNIRLITNGFSIIELADLSLDHKLGTVKRKYFFGIKISYISHNPFRLYYLVRNAIYIIKTNSTRLRICAETFYIVSKEVAKSLILEDLKMNRIEYLKKGVVDALKNKYGKLSEYN